jgi:pyruvate,water dikinase
VARALAALDLPEGGELAVRSSAVLEDGTGGSLAGLYESVLHVRPGELGRALGEFLAANDARAPGPYRGSVIVQQMVAPECSGVCLTRDPRTLRGDAVIIELSSGTNTGVTGGTVRPDRIVVDRRTGDVLEDVRRTPALRGRALDVTRLVREFLTLESAFGAPLDIEWALEGGELSILQARPIVQRSAAAERMA